MAADPEGFYSVVQKSGETDLSVVPRVKDDLERLRERYLPELSEIIETPQGDYRYRAWVDRTAFVDALARIGQKLDYDNFKSEVARRDPARARLYGKVWSVLGDLQPGGPYGAATDRAQIGPESHEHLRESLLRLDVSCEPADLRPRPPRPSIARTSAFRSGSDW